MISFKKWNLFLTIGLLNQQNILSKPVSNKYLDAESNISNISFITKAIKKTGASVVTIETQRFVKNNQ